MGSRLPDVFFITKHPMFCIPSRILQNMTECKLFGRFLANSLNINFVYILLLNQAINV